MIGKGKYDDHCPLVREVSRAEGVVVIVLNGDHGTGFSVQASTRILKHLPQILRDVADDIEKQPEIRLANL